MGGVVCQNGNLQTSVSPGAQLATSGKHCVVTQRNSGWSVSLQRIKATIPPHTRRWPTLAVTYWLAEKDGRTTHKWLLWLPVLEIIIHHPALHSTIPLWFPSPTLFHIPLPLKTAAQPEASKAGFTQQSSSRENGCCFQVLFAHLSGGDCSGENGVHVCCFFTSLYS